MGLETHNTADLSKRQVERPSLHHPRCPGCGGAVVRRAKEKSTAFRERRFCSFGCFSRSRIPAKADHEPCANTECAGSVERHPGESHVKWQGRQTCSPRCAAIVNGRAVSAARAADGRMLCPEIDPLPPGCFERHNLRFRSGSARLSSGPAA
jgi:hypothetical protein